jgi:hypothetical protein
MVSSEEMASMITVAVIMKGILLMLESLEKRSILLPYYRTLLQESTASMFNQWFY